MEVPGRILHAEHDIPFLVGFGQIATDATVTGERDPDQHALRPVLALPRAGVVLTVMLIITRPGSSEPASAYIKKDPFGGSSRRIGC